MVGMIRMKKTMCLCLLAAGLLLCPVGNAAVSFAAAYDQVASEDEKVAAQEVGLEGMIPVDGSEVSEGVYDVEVECSSSMFRIEKAVLTVKDGKMEAALTLSGTGYLKLFMGTGLEAAADDGSSYIDLCGRGRRKIYLHHPGGSSGQAHRALPSAKEKKSGMTVRSCLRPRAFRRGR